MLRKLSYWFQLDAADEAALLALPHRVKALEPHHYVVREREKAMDCCLMLSGFSVRHKIVVGGARQIVAIHMKGDMVDLQNSMLGVADHSVQMLTRGEVALIPRTRSRSWRWSIPGSAWRCGRTRWSTGRSSASGSPTWGGGTRRRGLRTSFANSR
jgi:hypothetical protein